jgi:hypothetical protein
VERLTLTPNELVEVTGRKYAAHQIRWLADNGWRFFVGGDGLPKVDREYYREMVGVKREVKKRVVRTEGLARGTQAHSQS